MILEMVFVLGLLTGLSSFLILFLLFYREDFKAWREFNKRQEYYKKMI